MAGLWCNLKGRRVRFGCSTDPDRDARRDRREQAVGCRAGDGKGASGELCAEQASLRSRAGAAAEQSGSAGPADEEPAAAEWHRPRDRRTPGYSMMLGADERLKGCAARTGKPASALDPLIRPQRLADMAFR